MKTMSSHKLNPHNWKLTPKPSNGPLRPQEAYSVNANKIAPSLFRKLKAELEDKMLMAGVDQFSRQSMKDALTDESQWLKANHNRSPETELFSFKPTILRQGLRSLFQFHSCASGTTTDGQNITLTCDSFERDRDEIKTAFMDYLTQRYEQARALGSSSATAWRQALLLGQKLLGDANLYDKILSLADTATLELEADLELGGTVNLSAKLEQLETRQTSVAGDVAELVADRRACKARNKTQGKKNRLGGVTADHRTAESAAHAKADLEIALERVHKRAQNGESVACACRWVCEHFATSGSTKYGNQSYYALMTETGKPMKPETLARYYRAAHPASEKRGKYPRKKTK